MKAKTSLTLSEDLLKTLDQLAGTTRSRSAFIEEILRDFVARREMSQRLARETAQINRVADELNAEMSDFLSFQDTAEE